jgi:hypothetical protein
VIQKNQQNELNNIIQAHYQQWIEKQSTEVKKQVPKKLYWGRQIGSSMGKELACIIVPMK